MIKGLETYLFKLFEIVIIINKNLSWIHINDDLRNRINE